ncbi:MAG: hypothetical protein HYR72_04710 [Deltaproteobacteria bacterium]|nr:hypothetical protein [Deltaproteobacteria bacterium]MBI3389813.1 hypothetical protein [Deltaproteobacteria bacterium]
MRWVYTIAATILTAALVFGCGGSAGDSLVLQFQNFAAPLNSQFDSVNQTSAEVDVASHVCPSGLGEPIEETHAVAVFVNREGADIVLDTISINNQVAGAAPVTRHVSSLVIGGRCGGNPSQQCALDGDCGLGVCQHSETQVSFLLFDFETKATVSTGTFNIPITFSGIDSRNARFTVNTSMTVTFEDFDHCPSTGGGQ